MIKFFRRIRPRLLSENRFSKYLIYAIGEILLVVVGILGAIQIDNWNEDKKERKIEQEYLDRLRDDLLKDTAYYKDSRQKANNIIAHYQKFTDNSYLEQTDYKSFSSLLCCIDFPPSELSIHRTTYSELLNTGKLNSIQDVELRQQIGIHYETFEKYNSHLIEFDIYTNRVLSNLNDLVYILKYVESLQSFLPEYEAKMLDNNSWKFINDPGSKEFLTLENTVATYHHKVSVSLLYLDEVESSTKELISRIDRELSN